MLVRSGTSLSTGRSGILARSRLIVGLARLSRGRSEGGAVGAGDDSWSRLTVGLARLSRGRSEGGAVGAGDNSRSRLIAGLGRLSRGRSEGGAAGAGDDSPFAAALAASLSRQDPPEARHGVAASGSALTGTGRAKAFPVARRASASSSRWRCFAAISSNFL